MASRERRKSQRLQLRLPISQLADSSGPVWPAGLWTRNVSAGGMFFEMPADSAPRRGSELSFELVVPPGEGYATAESKLRGAGLVVRRAPSGKGSVAIALRFNQPLSLSPGA